ncbi:MAG: hypothetical protein H6772_04125 [Pseudomonadales bacterium]|nr:hypothetical protein [Pseudomonadales bacterium]
MNKFKVAIAGTTEKTVLCAQTLLSNNQFELVWILTPTPKPVGRDQKIIPNPLDLFAKKNNLQTIHVDKKINEQIKEKILHEVIKPDFLLVVDFGYIIPKWLLDFPKIAPLNVHPSKLPRWRGSSPGQYSILFNDKHSAISLMTINENLDQGEIIYQENFEVNQEWTSQDYYNHAFNLICQNLTNKIFEYATNQNITTPQPEKSETITAKMLNKKQAFVNWILIKKAMNGEKPTKSDIKRYHLSDLLVNALNHNHSFTLTLERASKAFNPWPQLWTIVPTSKGEKRMKLLNLSIETETQKLIIHKIQFEGKKPSKWVETKNSIKE